ncbi:dinucleotide-utilizing enzyme [Actinobacteria bacterium IMCC26256]|nr:dinucleotide-utilizing enzyme [Actinobacteria bacterium IMCC26256]
MTDSAANSRTARVEALIAPLRNHHVVVIGCGSVGSHLADILVRHGVGAFTLVDPDTVEAPNLSRSVFRNHDVGQSKVQALSEHLRAIDPSANVCQIAAPLLQLDEDTITDVIVRADLVIAATDDPIAQAAINHRCYALGVPAVFASLYRGAEAGEIVATVPPVTPCFQCAVGNTTTTDAARTKDYGTGRIAAETALGADILTVVSVAAKHAIGLLSGANTPAGTTTLTALARHNLCIVATSPEWGWFGALFAGAAGQFAPQAVWHTSTRNPQCPICGEHPVAPLPSFSRHQLVAQRSEATNDSTTRATTDIPVTGGSFRTLLGETMTKGGDDMGKKLCPACNGSGGLYREVKEQSTGKWTKIRETCKRCKGAGEVD